MIAASIQEWWQRSYRNQGGRKVVLTFYLVSDTYADLKFSGVIDTSVKSIQRRFGEPAFDLQQLEACTQELQHILGDSLLKSSPVIVRLKKHQKAKYHGFTCAYGIAEKMREPHAPLCFELYFRPRKRNRMLV